MIKAPTSKQLFLDQLRAGLKGLPRSVIEETVADYEAHFEAGRAAGRTEADIASRLGDPARLARELRAEAGVRRWEDERSLSNALGAILGIMGLAALDLLVVLPVLLAVGSCVFAFVIAGAAVCLAGSLLLPFSLVDVNPFPNADWLQGVLLSLGLATGGASVVAFCVLLTIGIVNLLVGYGRAHYRLIAPTYTA
ncbi:DUF1700 domain-containing protein [Acetobacter tropicalis]|uniref:Uncharacterized protein n=2 Tax=Acetobacter TaxID=434 RepID=A0A0U4Y0N7_9PROT|nr:MULTISPECIES: DUF1700 domain-containing protein [Acetobacter]KXV61329.1 hypothetical protein AD948_02115 [Acetobacter senegalensis]MCG4254210.1 DUF1700 domain-containing protein [Acetobacter senegalensis]MCG4256875.1 DUF1700 domain-containing protein [Acetobacter senegalensis]MCG4261317.1 DUF1700 domain-containing protein [Acetobacter senegalensis]MCG4266986.1 DUF1700 domain-containing protein [Acetobacter senegalensis]